MAKVLRVIDENYVELPDMARITNLAISETIKRSTLDATYLSKCAITDGDFSGSRKKRDTALMAAWACAGLTQWPASETNDASDAIIETIIDSLDFQSRWYDWSKVKIPNAATPTGGIGITLQIVDGKLSVFRTAAKTPSRVAGIVSGDTIIAIDGLSTAELSLDDAVAKIRGPVDSSVTLTVQSGLKPLRMISMQRRKIDSVESTIEVYRRGNISIARVDSLPAGASAYLQKVISEQLPLSRAIILDLRDNGGGLLDEALQIADLFLDDGIIVTSKGRRADEVESYWSSRGQVAPDIPLFLLTSRNTASGAEIIASALQDNKRAIIIGQKSFAGNVSDKKYAPGSVQSLFMIDKNHGLKLTTSFQYRPNGKRISEAPIIPNCESSLQEEALVDFAIRVANNTQACLPQTTDNAQ